MDGVEPSQIAQNIITYFGGPGGGLLAGAAVLIVAVLCYMHVIHARMMWTTIFLVMMAWTGAWTVRTIIGWA